MPSERIDYVCEGFVHGVLEKEKKNAVQNTNREISSDMGGNTSFIIIGERMEGLD